MMVAARTGAATGAQWCRSLRSAWARWASSGPGWVMNLPNGVFPGAAVARLGLLKRDISFGVGVGFAGEFGEVGGICGDQPVFGRAGEGLESVPLRACREARRAAFGGPQVRPFPAG